MSMNFEDFIWHTLELEGGYVNHPKDPGGETKYGICKRQYPHLNIKDITKQDAIDIYKRDYWDKARCDEFPVPLAFCLFDFSVNSGHPRAIRGLQAVSRTKVDGIIGTKTLEAVAKFYSEDPLDAIKTYQAHRLTFLKKLRTWNTFGRGWKNRVERVQEVAVQAILEERFMENY